jgi:hypothetical protein
VVENRTVLSRETVVSLKYSGLVSATLKTSFEAAVLAEPNKETQKALVYSLIDAGEWWGSTDDAIDAVRKELGLNSLHPRRGELWRDDHRICPFAFSEYLFWERPTRKGRKAIVWITVERAREMKMPIIFPPPGTRGAQYLKGLKNGTR